MPVVRSSAPPIPPWKRWPNHYLCLPDLALIDIGLKGMIDGISVAAELAPLGVPVIFLTGDYQRAGHEGRELATDILIKPVSEKAILRAVASALHLDQD